jgi:hypothetical protein
MILKPIPLSLTPRQIREEIVIREGWTVRWDGQHFEVKPPPNLPPLRRA